MTVIKKFLLSLCLAVWILMVSSEIRPQSRVIDSLKTVLSNAAHKDTAYINTLNRLAFEYRNERPDTSRTLAQVALDLSEPLGYAKGKADALHYIGRALSMKNEYDKAMSFFLTALRLRETLNDTSGIASSLSNIGYIHSSQSRYAEAITAYRKALVLQEKLADKRSISALLDGIGFNYSMQGNYAQALDYYQRALNLSEELADKGSTNNPLNHIGEIYRIQGKYEEALSYYRKSLALAESLGNTVWEAIALDNIGVLYFEKGDAVQALKFYQQASALNVESKFVAISISKNLGQVFAALQRDELASEQYRRALMLAQETGDKQAASEVLNHSATLYLSQNNIAAADSLARLALKTSQSIGAKAELKDAAETLVKLFELQGKPDSAYRYLKLFVALKDSLFTAELNKQTADLTVKYEREKSERIIAALQKESDYQTAVRNALLGGVLALVVIAALIANGYRLRRQSETALQEKNNLLQIAMTESATARAEVELKNSALEKTLSDLKASQEQLVMQEKLASLGELVAGIAHEIQNPLNFVKNFSEVSVDTLGELKDELGKEPMDKAYLAELVEQGQKNLEKVTQHSGRASEIVSAMLQHARQSSGKREPTNLNAVLKEYFLLAFHGYRAKDASFNSAMTVELDAFMPPQPVVPQEVSRVFLNLIQNAFYSVNAKAKQSAGTEYKPEVKISSCRTAAGAEFHVWDNGLGISEAVKAKLFQPFFTTKKGTDGTGLGLSISNDIMKAHGGKISVSSVENEYAEFAVIFPKA